MAEWKEALGQTQSMLEGLHIPSGLVMPPVPPGAAQQRHVSTTFLILLPPWPRPGLMIKIDGGYVIMVAKIVS